VGGAQENTIATVLGLRKFPGVDVHLLSGPTTGPEGSLESQVRNEPNLFTLIPDLVRPVSPQHDWAGLNHLTRWFQAWKPDIVHTHSGKAGVLGRLAARRAGTPVIIHTIHGPSFGPFQGRLANFLFKSAERWAGRATTHFVSVSQAMKDQYLAVGIGRPSQYTTIYSGFPLEPYLQAKNDLEVRRQFGLREHDFVVGKVARLFKLKGHDDLFAIAPELVRRIPNVRFLLVGGGPWEERFVNRARREGLADRFIFTGLVAPEQVPALVGIMDVLAHLSTREGLPRSLPQALAAGRPVVAYDCDGAREICLDGQTGFLIPNGNRRMLADRMAQLADDRDLARKFGQTGRAFVQERFSVEKMVADIYELYFRLLRR
jgi:glycosyltransferase involved in cell wall biosynthesis